MASSSGPTSRRPAESTYNEEPTEDTPLLSREQDDPTTEDRHANGNRGRSPAASLLLRSIQGPGSGKASRLERWPSFLALLILCIVVILVLIVAFLAPEIAREYSSQAVQFEATSLSLASFSASGVVAHIQGMVIMDASRVKKKSVRDLGRFGTWIVREVESKPMEVTVSLPELEDPTIGTAQLPPVKVDVRDGHITAVDIFADLTPGSTDAIRRVADDWLTGSLGQLRVQAAALVQFKSGLFTFPKHVFTRSLVIQGDDIPTMPKYHIKKLNVDEEDLPDGRKGLAARASIKVKNSYPIKLTVPPLDFAVSVPNCASSDPPIMLAHALTHKIHVHPREDVAVHVTGFIRELPDAVLNTCPQSHKSPLDDFLGKYIHGNDTTIFVRGSDSPFLDTPEWLTDILSEITVPVPIPGHEIGSLIKDFSLDNVHFDLPDFFADPDSPDSKPKISANITALIDLPEEIKFPVNVHQVKADTDLYYRKKKFALLDLSQWRKATSKRVKNSTHHEDLEVRSEVVKAPLTITDGSVFSEVVQQILTGQSGVNLTAKATVDVKMETVLGKMVVKDIPAEGDVPVNPLGGGDMGSISLKVGNLQIVETSPDSITVDASVNFTNPTKYSAKVPYFDVKVLVNDTLVGHATVQDVIVRSEENRNVRGRLFWDPKREGAAIGREFISQYLSGYNVSLTFKTHEGSVPAQPSLGKALSVAEVTLPLPHLSNPHDGDGDGDDDGDDDLHFIRGTTMHLLTSTATFSLLSPLTTTTVYLTYLNATAIYHGDRVGHITFDSPPEPPIEVPPGKSETPRLDVDWSLGSVGYEAIKNALGGTLKLEAFAHAGLRIGQWQERVWFKGKGIGAKVRF